MNRAIMQALANHARVERVEPGTTIVRQGRRADAFYVLLSGTVEISRRSPQGDSQRVSSLNAPAFFGERGLLEDGRRTASVLAAGDTAVELLVVEREIFAELVEQSDLLAEEIAILMRRYRIRDSLSAVVGPLSSGVQEEFLTRGQILIFGQGDEIVRQGDEPDYFYVVTKGRVEVLHTRDDGRTFLVSFHEPGDFFGEIGLLTRSPRSATVRAAEETELLAFDETLFQELLENAEIAKQQVWLQSAERLARTRDNA